MYIYTTKILVTSLSIAILYALVLLLTLAEESVEVEGELLSRASATAAASSPFKHA